MQRFGIWVIVEVLALVLGGGLKNGQAQTQDQCRTCHRELLEDAPSQKYVNDVHFQKGISCAGCHGGDPTQADMDAAMDPKKGYIGVPKGTQVTQTCNACHANESRMAQWASSIDTVQFQRFETSVHGKADVATCISCHDVHEIRPSRDPQSPTYPTREVFLCARCHADPAYMRKFNPALPTDQLEKYWTSRHGQRLQQGDTWVATCSDCHTAHTIYPPKDPRSSVYAVNVPIMCARCHSDPAYMKPYGIPTNQYDLYASTAHGRALLEKHDTGAPACNDCHGNHGAMPPGVQTLSHVCGLCHTLNAEYFSKSPHAAAFEKKGLPQCEACHGNHEVPTTSLDQLRPEAPVFMCRKCHSMDDKGTQVARMMYETIRRLVTLEEEARRLLTAAEQKGMDVADAWFQLRDVHNAYLKARTVVHTSDPAEVQKVVEPAVQTAEQARTAGQRALAEFDFRRKGFAFATLWITLLVIALYLKIRQIEARSRDKRLKP